MRKLSTIILLCVSFALSAQHTLVWQRNHFRSGDRIVKQQVEYVDPGYAGKKMIWDFSKLNAINEKYRLAYYSQTEQDTSHYVGIEHDTRYDYQYRKDTLWLNGFENRTTRMAFTHPEAQLHFPFHYGDSLVTSFAGKGLYGDKIPMVAVGKTVTTVDGSGTLLLPEGEELNNVVRVKRLRCYTEVGKDSMRINLETYSWYALGYRYPVFETIRTYILRGDAETEHFSTSFYSPISYMRELREDPDNIGLQNKPANDYLLSCKTYPNPVLSNMTVRYELSQDARVSFRICDLSGYIWADVPPKTVSSGFQQQYIRMDNLPKGDYALYLMVDDKAYQLKVIKK